MPCLILTGSPCSGKTTFAKLLSKAAINHPSKKISSTIIINEESIPSLSSNYKSKNDCYENSKTEKSIRSSLRSTFDKYCHSCKASRNNDNNSNNNSDGSTTLIILDSLNYIKGFRYELHCISKSVNERHGVIWITTNYEQCKYWNNERNDADKLIDDLMDGLVQRYEPPDDRNRWDKPLYRVDMSNNSTTTSASTKVNDKSDKKESDVFKKSVYNMHSIKEALQEKEIKISQTSPSPALDTIPNTNDKNIDKSITKEINDILDHFLSSKPLKQGQSTKSILPSESNSLHNIDKVTTSFISSIKNVQQQQMATTTIPGKLSISVNNNQNSISLQFHRFVSISELRRLRKSFVQFSKNQPPKDCTEFGICVSFARYLEQQIV